MVRDRKWALDQLRHQKNSLMMTLAGMSLLKNIDDKVIRGGTVLLRRDAIIFNFNDQDKIGFGNTYGFDFKQIADDRLNNLADFEITLEETWKNARRNAIKEGYETTKTYANSVGAYKKLEAQPWYGVLRAVRNAISHNFIFGFSVKEMQSMPFSWNGKLIESSMDGAELQAHFLDPAFTIEAMSAFEDFVRNH